MKTTVTEKLKKQQLKRFVKSQTRQRVQRSPEISKHDHNDQDLIYDPETYEKMLIERDERNEHA